MEKSPIVVQQFKAKYRTLVHRLIEIRKESRTNQDFMSDWLKVDRKRIIRFETFKKIDLELLLLYSVLVFLFSIILCTIYNFVFTQGVNT